MNNLSEHVPLSALLHEVTVVRLIGREDISIRAITMDSRTVQPGTLFVAVKGSVADGHDYIQQATAAGSIAIVCEAPPPVLQEGITYVLVSDSAKTVGFIAANFYGRPASKLKLVAATGTNGKTSTVHLLAGLFRRLGYRVGMLSTIHNQADEEVIPARLTTPDAIELHRLLARMVAAGCQYCFMEASSHALVQGRLEGLQLAGAIFLNITHDHLDYHKTFAAYIQAKKKLFDELPATAFALYNADDKRGTVMVQNTRANPYSFALQLPADFTAKLLANSLQGLELRIHQQSVCFQLIGTFNAYNLLAVYATACLLGVDSTEALVQLSALPPIQGRFQHVHAPAGFDAIVDYAHTPDALQNVLQTISDIKARGGQMITVIGCGGDRDRAKRPIMAQVAWKFSDRVIFTADNPRSEQPQDIIEEMKAGLTAGQQQQTLVIVDRAEAIKTACRLAQPQDVVLVAGKGHEPYQEVAGKRYDFDDRKVLEQVLFSVPQLL